MKEQINKKKCPQCNSNLKKVMVNINDVNGPVESYQCLKCWYFYFDKAVVTTYIEKLRGEII